MLQQTCTSANVQITPVDATPTQAGLVFEYLGCTKHYQVSFHVIDLPKDSGCYLIVFTIGGANNTGELQSDQSYHDQWLGAGFRLPKFSGCLRWVRMRSS